MTSPAERYTAALERNSLAKTELGTFASGIDFPLDPFQQEACQALEAGKGVLVAAPTGAGKTIVGEFAVFLAQAQGKKAFYTTPIKALSNQKYAELVKTYGADRVGLLTGDVSINSEADIVVMTTEVLRNMIYADSSTLKRLGFVVMDEVHYLADKFRGAVWEEIIIHLPRAVQLVSLSATVSNAEEFGAWLDTVRGDTEVVVSEHRPIPLWQHVMVGDRIKDLFVDDVPFDQLAVSAAQDGIDAQVNPELIQLAKEETQYNSVRNFQRGRGKRPRRYVAPQTKHRLASRVQVIRELDAAGLLPVIYFIFSRNGSDQAVQECIRGDLWLTDAHERAEIEREIELAAKSLPESDREVLGFWSWRDGLLRGVAAHHAGLLPIFKETVEKLFARGLIKAVFATETLALGVNMPARSVVLEKLDKFNGESHVNVTPGEYTQLTGRAGRRGIDVEGHAVVLWQPGTDPAAVANLASRRSYPLNSSFRPTYNMSINLVAQFGVERTRRILESSFAQFQVDRSVVGLAKEVRTREESLKGFEKSMACDRGDFSEYMALRERLSELERGGASYKSEGRRSAIRASLEDLERGDVAAVSARRFVGNVIVLDPDQDSPLPRPLVLTENRQVRHFSMQELREPLTLISRVKVPKRTDVDSAKVRRDLTSAMQAALHEGKLPRSRELGAELQQASTADAQIRALRAQLRAHPCHDCPDRENHARWAARARKLRRDTEKISGEIRGRTNTIVKIFDRVCSVLIDNGYLIKDDDGDWRPSARGQQLRRIYGERDLLTSLSLASGVFDGLDPAQLAAFATIFVYQARRDEPGLPGKLPPGLAQPIDSVIRLWSELTDEESQARLPETGEPSFGLVWPMYRWASGRALAKVLEDTDLAAGDFVRWAKQVIDLLDQIAKVPGISSELKNQVGAAIELIRRGVVAYSDVSAPAE